MSVGGVLHSRGERRWRRAVDRADAQERSVNLSQSITVNAPLPGEDPLIFGNPSNATTDTANENNFLMPKPQYTLSYNRAKGTANWVAWRLDSSWIGTAQRQDDFRPDPALPAGWYQVLDSDYSGSAKRAIWSPGRPDIRSLIFFDLPMTNGPQISANIRGLKEFESYAGTLARSHELSFSRPVGNIGTIAKAGHRSAVPWRFVVMPNGSDDLPYQQAAALALSVKPPPLISCSVAKFQ